MKLRILAFTLASLAIGLVGCAEEEALDPSVPDGEEMPAEEEEGDETDDVVSDTDSAYTRNCLGRGTTCLSVSAGLGSCRCPAGWPLSSCILSSSPWYRVNPEFYGGSYYTPWSGGGDVKVCTRKQVRFSWSTAFTTYHCVNRVKRKYVVAGIEVQKSRGSVASTFGNTGQCGLFEQWGPWGSWVRR